MIRPRASITIAAPPRDVIRFIADPATAPLWMKALESSKLITPGPIGPGSRFLEVQSAGGQRIETICEVVEYDGETRYAWQSHAVRVAERQRGPGPVRRRLHGDADR